MEEKVITHHIVVTFVNCRCIKAFRWTLQCTWFGGDWFFWNKRYFGVNGVQFHSSTLEVKQTALKYLLRYSEKGVSLRNIHNCTWNYWQRISMFTMNETLASLKASRKTAILSPGTRKSVNKICTSKFIF